MHPKVVPVIINLGGTVEYTLEKNKHRLFAIGGYNQELTK